MSIIDALCVCVLSVTWQSKWTKVHVYSNVLRGNDFYHNYFRFHLYTKVRFGKPFCIPYI